MSASTLGADALDELFALESDCRWTIASDARRLTLEALDGFPLSHVRSVAGQQHVLVDALTAAPDALSRGTFPVATGERPSGPPCASQSTRSPATSRDSVRRVSGRSAVPRRAGRAEHRHPTKR